MVEGDRNYDKDMGYILWILFWCSFTTPSL